MHWLLIAATSVLILGDSHVRGRVSAPVGPSFAEVVQQELGGDYRVVAAGCDGSTVVDWTTDGASVHCGYGNAYPTLGRPNLPADVVVILLGTNDAVGWSEPEPVTPEVYAQRMDALVDRVTADGGGALLLLGPPPAVDPTLHPDVAARLDAYGAALRALARRRPNVRMGPELGVLLNREDHFAPRKTHMNASGHRLLGERLAAAVRALDATQDAGEDPAATATERSGR